MPAVVMTGIVREYISDVCVPRGHDDRVRWREGRRRGRPEVVQLQMCRLCGDAVFDHFTRNSEVPREANGDPQTCFHCGWRMLYIANKRLPPPACKGHATWYELAFLHSAASIYLKEYNKAKRERRI